MKIDDAEKTLKDNKVTISDNKSLFNLGWYLGWNYDEEYATLDGRFTAKELESVARWMREYRKKK